MLADSMLTPTRTACALTLPPYENRVLLKSMVFMEKSMEQWCRNFAGVLIVEAEKQIYAANPRRGLKQSLIPAIKTAQNLACDHD